MLLIKLRNAAELLWDSLDAEERQVMLYALVWFAISVVAAVRRAQRDSFKREVLAEVIAAQSTLAVLADAS